MFLCFSNERAEKANWMKQKEAYFCLAQKARRNHRHLCIGEVFPLLKWKGLLIGHKDLGELILHAVDQGLPAGFNDIFRHTDG